MRSVSPEGGVYQAGTLSGNPVAMAAGIATLKLLSSSKVYERLLEKTRRLAKGLRDAARAAKISVQVPYACGMLSLYFSSKKVNNLTDAQNSKTKLFGKFFHEMLSRGIYLPPSPYEAWFISLAHGENEIAKTLRAAKDSFQYLQKNFR
jgi:glutamate-1-semialdehyde 2,1-aminomutase